MACLLVVVLWSFFGSYLNCTSNNAKLIYETNRYCLSYITAMESQLVLNLVIYRMFIGLAILTP